MGTLSVLHFLEAGWITGFTLEMTTGMAQDAHPKAAEF